MRGTVLTPALCNPWDMGLRNPDSNKFLRILRNNPVSSHCMRSCHCYALERIGGLGCREGVWVGGGEIRLDA